MEPERRARYLQLYSALSASNSASLKKPAKRISFLNNETNHFTDMLVRNRRRRQQQGDLVQAAAPLLSSPSQPGSENKAIEETSSLLQLLRSRRQSAVSTQLAAATTTDHDHSSAASEPQHVVEDEDRGRRKVGCSRKAGCCCVGCLCGGSSGGGYGGGGSGPGGAAAATCGRSCKSRVSHYIDSSFVLQAHALRGIMPTGKRSHDNVSSPLPPPPQFSLRRSVCPVCSEKWRDRSSIHNIKNSGLKRKSALDRKTSVIAPARLQTAIRCQYNPRPILEEVDSGCTALSGLRIGGFAWQLSRARRLRASQAELLRARSPQAHSAQRQSPRAPLSQADLERRVNSFISH